jgi:hypothetical protein
MRSTEDCIAQVAAKGAISQKAAAQILEDLAVRAEKMRTSGADDPIVAAAGAAGMAIKEKARADFLDAVRNADARARMMERATGESVGGIAPQQTLAGRLVPGMKKLGMADGLRSMMHWVPGADAKDSAETMWQSLSRNMIAAVGNRLRRDGVEKAALAMRGTELEHEVAEAMWRANGGAPDANAKISTIGQKIADAMSPALDLLKRRQNAEGARIGTAVDYVTHTNWDPRQLRRAAGPTADPEAAFEAWRAREEPRMAEKTFDDIEPNEGETEAEARTRFLRSVFFATASGVHLRQPGMAGMAADEGGFVPPAFEGTHNIARSVSQPRVVYWNNARDWLDHMREFGGGDGLYAQVSRTLNTGARKTALMHYFGTNPAANLNMVIRKIQEQNREDLDGLHRFNNQTENLRNTMGRLDGSLNIPANADHAQAFETLMSLEAAAHLGGVSVTHLSAAPGTFGAEMAHHGVGRMETLGNIARAIVRGRGDQIEQDALADAGAYAHGYANAQARAAGAFDHGIPGFASWAAGHFMRLTGLPQVLDKLQAHAVKSVLMDRLGRASGETFDKIEEHQRVALGSYGIGSDEWDLIRNAAGPAMVNGKRWVTPHDGTASDPAEVEAMLRTRGELTDKSTPKQISDAVQGKQWDMADRLGMYLDDAADHGAVRPGVRERAMMLGNLRPGDKSYMLWRALGQFKMWPLAAANQILGREIAMSLSKKEMFSNIGALLALGTAGGALRMAVNDAASGNVQRDYRNPVTLLAALAQGGGLGIYGDFLFGETSRLGSGGIATMVGPIGSDVDRFYRMYTDLMVELRDRPDHALSHLAPDLIRFAVGHVPFANLIYLKGALDYLLWYHLYEAASPGWWERTNRRIAREQGRTMQGYEPGGGVPGGVPGLYGSGWGRLMPQNLAAR